MKYAWCWFCWKLTNEWWPLDAIGWSFRFYLLFLPWAGEYIYWDYDFDAPDGERASEPKT